MVHGSSFNSGGDVVLILAIDPGNIESAYVLLDNNLKLVEKGKIENEVLLENIGMDRFWYNSKDEEDYCAIEMIASYGMPVGKEVFDTCVWIGRFVQAFGNGIVPTYIYRKDEKINLCGSMKAKDSNIRQALIDRFAQFDFKNGKGTIKKPDWFHGFKADMWQAYAVGVTFYDMHIAPKSRAGQK